MSKLKVAALVLGVALVLLSPQRAAATDYVFTVTVDVRTLHPTVTTGQVQCMVLSSMIEDAPGSVIGSNTTPFTLTGGSYAGPAVEVRIHIPGRSRGIGWRCYLRFTPPGGASPVAADFLSTPGPSFRAEFERAPGSPFVYKVEARL